MKTSKNIIEFCISFVLIITLFMLPFAYFSYTVKWAYIVDDFDVYKNDFENLVSFSEEYYNAKVRQDNTDLEKCVLGVGYDIINKHHILFDDERIDMKNDVRDSLDRIANDAFCKNLNSDLYVIVIRKNRIAFEIDTGQYALVYSFDDSKPTYIASPDDGQKISVRKIEKYWYHVVLDH